MPITKTAWIFLLSGVVVLVSCRPQPMPAITIQKSNTDVAASSEKVGKIQAQFTLPQDIVEVTSQLEDKDIIEKSEIALFDYQSFTVQASKDDVQQAVITVTSRKDKKVVTVPRDRLLFATRETIDDVAIGTVNVGIELYSKRP